MRPWTPGDWVQQLREDVQLIAAEADEQERWLMEHRFPVDEIALQFNDYVVHRLSLFRHAGLMTSELEEALRRLDDHFGSFSGPENAVRWSEDALYGDPVWAEARQQARAILGLIDAVTASS